MVNYLNDAMHICFSKPDQYVVCSDEHKKGKTKVTICGKYYKDPDLVSKQLYADVSQCFKFNSKTITSKTKRGNLVLEFEGDDKYEHEMSTDYIGPSRAWACKYLDGDLSNISVTIGDFLLISRTIGGHVFWPAHKVKKQNTINQVRGGSGIYDRFDITLAELKQYFAAHIECKIKDEFCFYKPLYDAFKRYKWFFEEYKTFDNYIEKMKLDMFLNKNEVFSLVDSDVENEDYKSVVKEEYEPKNYVQYIKNCKILIEKRTKILENELGTKM